MSAHPKPKCPRCRRVARAGHTCPVRTPIARSPLPKAGKPIARAGKPKAVNRTRRSRERVRAYGVDGRVRWVAGLPCAAAGRHECYGKIENAHAVGGGGSRKADARYIFPACARLHREIHSRGAETTGAKYGLNWLDEAARTETLWQAFCDCGWNTPDMWPGHQA